MALSSVDHFLMGHAQRQHEKFLENLTLAQSELLQEYTSSEAGFQAYDALVRALIESYDAQNLDKLHTLLTDQEAREAVFRPVYNRVRNNILSRS